ncbi:MAG: ATP-binding protein [Rhodobacteraceae bacterium]|nr:ATP-binding protein [Paracoccaceae bacterium]
MSKIHNSPRHLVSEINEALATSRVVNLVGPRQVGKTTLVRDLLATGNYITLDDEGILEAIRGDPEGQLKSLRMENSDGPLIIDEAQRCGELAMAMKIIVDGEPRKGQFLLTGSSNLFASASAMDSLAGRVRILRLWPMSVSEIREVGANRLLDWGMQRLPSLSQIGDLEVCGRRDCIGLLLAGGFPEPRTVAIKPRQRMYRDYVDSIVDRDVAEVLNIRKSDMMRRLIFQMAARTGTEINMSKLAKAVGVNRATLDSYLDILASLSLVIRLGSWTSGESRREVRHAKYHFVDPGMGCALRYFDDRSFTAGQPHTAALGGLLESFVLGELIRAQPIQDQECRFYHWRSADGKEVDILAEAADRMIGFEVKASSTVSAADFRHLNWFASKGPGRRRNFCGIVFYMGQQKLSFGENRFALPISSLWARIETDGTQEMVQQPQIDRISAH